MLLRRRATPADHNSSAAHALAQRAEKFFMGSRDSVAGYATTLCA